jgi:hypothetical protein
MRSTVLRRGFRPAAITAAVTLPYARAVSASKGIGSNSCSARCSTSSRRARSAASKYRSCSASDRTSCGPAESSASVTALIAISSGSSSGAIQLRRIMMLVSTRPRCTGSSVIRTAALIGRCILVRPERVRVDHRGAPRHGGELRSRYEPATLAQRHKLANPVTIPGHRESLTTLDSIHDFLRPHPQVALGDLRLSAHGIHGSTRCYSVLSPTRSALASHARRPRSTASTRRERCLRSSAEADGNRTRRRRVTPPTGFEDRGGHQAPRRLRGRRYPRPRGVRHPARARDPAGRRRRTRAGRSLDLSV